MTRINAKQKELIMIYAFVVLVMIILMNWQIDSWLFNTKVVSVFAEDLFGPTSSTRSNVAAVSGSPIDYTNDDNYLKIPKLGVLAPVVVGESVNVSLLENDLNRGVVYYPGSALPGQDGQIVILGHSAPLGWPNIKYDNVFSNIDSLQAGDQIILGFGNNLYTYKVVDKSVIQKGQDISSGMLNGQNNILTLISCWPPGEDLQRIKVDAQLQET